MSTPSLGQQDLWSTYPRQVARLQEVGKERDHCVNEQDPSHKHKALRVLRKEINRVPIKKD
jgi:hypothetical protein